MQEHIQQVSLSELMTSWSHILPAPLPQSGGTEGQWEVCVRVWEWVCSGGGGGVFYSGDGLTGEGGAPALQWRKWSRSWAPLIHSPLGLLVLRPSIHPWTVGSGLTCSVRWGRSSQRSGHRANSWFLGDSCMVKMNRLLCSVWQQIHTHPPSFHPFHFEKSCIPPGKWQQC